MSNTNDLLRYPIGKFSPKETYTSEEKKNFIDLIRELPAKAEALVKDFTPEQWNTPYREGGWNARQVIHHLADSHMNAYIRIKWTLTEDSPVIKAYDEKLWAETPETRLDPALSLLLLKGLHAKWAALLENLDNDQLKKFFVHPETKREVTLERMLGLYSWHGEHHLGHLNIIRQKA